MHFQFKARIGPNEVSMLVSKDMSVKELIDALFFALQIAPYSQIVGFREPTSGIIIPPSVVCSDPDQIIKNEVYEVMIQQLPSQQFHGSLGGPSHGANQSASNHNTQLGETQASFNARVSGIQQLGTNPQSNLNAPPNTSAHQFNNVNTSGQIINTSLHSNGVNGFRGVRNQEAVHGGEFGYQQQQPPHKGEYAESALGQDNLTQKMLRDQLQQSYEESALVSRQNIGGQNGHSRQPSATPGGMERERNPIFQFNEEAAHDIIKIICSWELDALLTESLKQKILLKIHNEDIGILGAYRLYLTDRDMEGFKARIIHKVLGGHLGTAGNNMTNLTLSGEERQSSMTTAGFNRSAEYLSRFSRGSTGVAGGNNLQQPFNYQHQGAVNLGNEIMKPQTNIRFQRFVRPMTADHHQINDQYSQNNTNNRIQGSNQIQSSQDRYLPIIINLEQQNLLDEQIGAFIKTLILEENYDVFMLINSYIAQAIDEQELCFKFIKLAKKLGVHIDRLFFPHQRTKAQIMQSLNNLTRYHFAEIDDIDILNNLIQNENEKAFQSFQAYEIDKDQENLVEKLQRIINKQKRLNNINAGIFNGRAPHIQTQNYVNNQQRQQSLISDNFGFIFQNNKVIDTVPFTQDKQALRPETSLQHKRPSKNVNQIAAEGQMNNNNIQSLDNRNQFDECIGSWPPIRAQSFAKSDALMREAEIQRRNKRIDQNYYMGINQTNSEVIHGQRRRERSHVVGGINQRIQAIQAINPLYQNGIPQSNNPQFQPKPTIVHNVALIPNYFSSGEEDEEFKMSHPFAAQHQRSQKAGNIRAENDGFMYQKAGLDFYGANPYHSDKERAYFNTRERFPLQYGVTYANDSFSKAYHNQESFQATPLQYRHFSDYENKGGSDPRKLKQNLNGYKQPKYLQGYPVYNYSNDQQPVPEPYPRNYSDQFVNEGSYMLNNQILIDDQGRGGFNPNSNYHTLNNLISKQTQKLITLIKAQNVQKQKMKKKLKNNKHKKYRKNHHKKYSSEEEKNLTDFDEEEMNNRAGIVSMNNYKEKNDDKSIPAYSSSQTSSSNSSLESGSSSSSSDASSASKKLIKKTKKNLKQAKQNKKLVKKEKQSAKKDTEYQPSHSKKHDEKIHKHQIDFKRIIDEEKLAEKLNVDNFAILLYLIDVKDQEVSLCFKNHLKARQSLKYFKDQMSDSQLVSQLAAKTEDAYQVLLEKNLSNEEYTIVKNKRKIKDERYLNCFHQMMRSYQSNQKVIDALIYNLKSVVQQELMDFKLMMGQQQHRENKEFETVSQINQSMKRQNNADEQMYRESIERTFYTILYDSFKGNSEKEQFLRQQFQAQNQQLYRILIQYSSHGDGNIMNLRNQINQFIQQHLGPDVYKNLREAIIGLFERQAISAEDKDMIRELSFIDDKHLMAAWDTYTVTHDEEDFIHTLQVLCQVKRQNQSQSKSQQESFSLQRPNNNNDGLGIQQMQLMQNKQPNNNHIQNPLNSNTSSVNENNNQGSNNDYLERDQNQNQQYENKKSQPPQFLKLFGQSDQNQYQNNYKNIHSLQISTTEDGNNNDLINQQNQIDVEEDGGEEAQDPEYIEDIDGIMQYQHKILRKYAMLGMIHYSAVPFFHQLVENTDYKMNCIFEVFAQNRNEDDFLENLGILNNIRLNDEDHQQMLNQEIDEQKQQAEENTGRVGSTDELVSDDSQTKNNYAILEKKKNYQNWAIDNRYQESAVDSKFSKQSDFKIQQKQDPVYSYKEEDYRNNYANNEELDESQEGEAPATTQLISLKFGQDAGVSSSAGQGDLKYQPQKKEEDRSHVNENQGKPDQRVDSSVQDDPNLAILFGQKSRLKDEEFEFAKNLVAQSDKRILMLLKCLVKTKDANDFANSIQRFYNKSVK